MTFSTANGTTGNTESFHKSFRMEKRANFERKDWPPNYAY
jgi:hypothetical protein